MIWLTIGIACGFLVGVYLGMSSERLSWLRAHSRFLPKAIGNQDFYVVSKTNEQRNPTWWQR